MAKVRAPGFESKFSYLLLRFFLYAVLAMPLLFWSGFLFPFITTKVIYFRLLIEIALAIYLVLALRYPELRPKWNWLLGTAWIYFLIIFLASILGLNFYRSFWGTVERGEGLLTILHFMIYFSLLPQVFRTRKDWYNYLFFAVTATAINALYGLGQALNLSFLTNTTGTRVAGTIGNPAFFAAYLLFGVFLSLYLIWETDRGKKRKFLWAIFLFDLYILYKTATRGVLIALAFVLVLYLIMSIFRKQARIKLKIASLIGLLLLAGFGFLVYQNRNSAWVNKSEGLSRLATISRGDITTQSRFDTWQTSWKSWKDRLVLGYGYENFNLAFNKYFPARVFKDAGSQIWFDRAHNLLFDLGVTSGLVGLLAYAGIIGAAFYYLIKLYRKFAGEADAEKYVFLLLGLLAYLIQNLFVFDTQATYLMFFLTLGFMAALYQMEFVPSIDLKQAAAYRPGWVVKSLTAIFLLVVVNWFNFQPARANYNTTQGIKAAKSQQYKQVKPAFEKALSHGTYMDEEIRQRLVDNVIEAAGSGQLSGEEQRELFDYLIKELRKNLADSPKDVRNHMYLLAVLNRAQGYFPEIVNEALALALEAEKISPTRPQVYFEMGQTYFFKKDYDRGLQAFQRGVDLASWTKEAHLNLLLAAIISGRPDIQEREDKILKDSHNLTISDYQSIARAFTIGGNRQGAIGIYQRVSASDPKNHEPHAKLAALYGELCDLENAKKEVDIIMELDQSYILQGQNFLRELEAKCQK